MKNKPTIAITHSDNQSLIQLLSIRLAVFLAGGRATLISPTDKTPTLQFDGLIIYGGKDINPELYGGTVKPNYPYDDARDQLEMDLLKAANSNDLPVLGICRGAQLINIFHGGTLHFDISKAYEKAQYPSNLLGYLFFRKRITIESNSLLNKIVKKTTIRVNSLHRQSIDQLGDTLIITSQETNGVIQSIENQNKDYHLGVQFHPEFLLHRKRFRNIFRQLVLAAKRRQSQ